MRPAGHNSPAATYNPGGETGYTVWFNNPRYQRKHA